MDEKPDCCAELLKFRDEILALRSQIYNRRNAILLNYNRQFITIFDLVQQLDNLILEIIGDEFKGASGGVS